MTSADQTSSPPPQPSGAPPARSRIGLVFSGSRELVRVVYRDPEHVAERLTLYASDSRGHLSSAHSVR